MIIMSVREMHNVVEGSEEQKANIKIVVNFTAFNQKCEARARTNVKVQIAAKVHEHFR